MTNFDYLKQEPKFKSFADVAIAAEKVLHIDMEPRKTMNRNTGRNPWGN
ncbi:MAG: hypothetical protein K2M46_13310 [Lachnospiraceae bacterium]|nr:hypothetical protein [Lachnospiraceae bacterium]